MATDDVAMLLRGVDGNVAVQQSLDRDLARNESSKFWETLADLFFASESFIVAATKSDLEKCAAVGSDPIFTCRIADQLRLCRSALLVRVRGQAQRETVTGVLQGFVRNVGSGESSSRFWKTEIQQNSGESK